MNQRRLFIKRLSALGFGSILTTGCVTTGGSFGPLVRKEDNNFDEETLEYFTRFIEDNRKVNHLALKDEASWLDLSIE